MVEFMLTIIGFAGAMTVPGFLTVILESTASKIPPAPVRAAPRLERLSCVLYPARRCRRSAHSFQGR